MYFGFVEVITGQLNYNHDAAHGTESQEVGIGNEHGMHLLDNMEASFISVFIKRTYPVWENHVCFTIPFIDTAVLPARCCLYFLSKVK